MGVDSTKIMEKLVKTEFKKSYSITISPSVMEPFKKECDRLGLKYSPVIEEMIKEFIESAKSKKK